MAWSDFHLWPKYFSPIKEAKKRKKKGKKTWTYHVWQGLKKLLQVTALLLTSRARRTREHTQEKVTSRSEVVFLPTGEVYKASVCSSRATWGISRQRCGVPKKEKQNKTKRNKTKQTNKQKKRVNRLAVTSLLYISVKVGVTQVAMIPQNLQWDHVSTKFNFICLIWFGMVLQPHTYLQLSSKQMM